MRDCYPRAELGHCLICCPFSGSCCGPSLSLLLVLRTAFPIFLAWVEHGFHMFPSLTLKSSQRDTKLKPNGSASNHIPQSRGVPPKAPPSFVLDAPDSGTSAPHWAPSLPSTRSTPLKSCQLTHVFSPGSLPFPGLLPTWHLHHQTSQSVTVYHFIHSLITCSVAFVAPLPRQGHRVSSRPTASLLAFSVNFLGHTIQTPQPMKQCCPHPWWSSPP